MTSKACLRGLEEGEKKVEGKDIAYEGGNTDKDIDNFTLEPEEMEASALGVATSSALGIATCTTSCPRSPRSSS